MVLFSVTCIAFIGAVIWALLEIRRTVGEAQQTLTAVRGHLVLLIQEMRETTEQADGLVREVRDAFESTSTLWYALGDLGQSIERVRTFAREKGGWIAHLLNAVLSRMIEGSRATHAGTNGSTQESQFVKRRSADD